MAQKKQFAPSSRKKDRARKRGKVHKSQLLSLVMVVTGIQLAALCLFSESWVENQMLLHFGEPQSRFDLTRNFWLKARLQLFISVVCIGAGSAAGLIVECLQLGGVRPSLGALSPRMDRLYPGSFFKRFRNIWLLVVRMLLGGAGLVVFLIWFVCRFKSMPLSAGNQYLPLLISAICLLIALTFIAGVTTAVIDYFVELRRYKIELSMSVDELRREQKEDQGDPVIKVFRHNYFIRLQQLSLEERIKNSRVLIVGRNREARA